MSAFGPSDSDVESSHSFRVQDQGQRQRNGSVDVDKPIGPRPAQSSSESPDNNTENRERALRRELEGIRSVNEVVERVLSSLDRAKINMEVCAMLSSIRLWDKFLTLEQTVSTTVTSASTLLNMWIRILSQTEHNQRLLLDPQWQGATQDIHDVENESVLRQQAAERREIEERLRKEAAAQAAAREAELRQKESEGQKGRRGSTLGRGRASSRGSSRGLDDRVSHTRAPSNTIGRGSTRGSTAGGRSGTGSERGTTGLRRGRPAR
jgi:hypothetical protein